MPGFAASADFAIDKPAGQPCPHLGTDFGCTIHGQLRERGFAGCTVYDCFGAGQKVTHLARGQRRGLFGAFTVTRQLHELLWYLSAALGYPAAEPYQARLSSLLQETERLTYEPAGLLTVLDVGAHRTQVNEVLRQVSTAARSTSTGLRERRRRRATDPLDFPGADLMGRDLRLRRLQRADLRGAYLLGADLRGVDFALADLLGADLRRADVRSADLSRALFLTQMQVNAARGDAGTGLPDMIERPAHWSGSGAGP
ncbi:MAG TPA: pentapeptide repeat-containing protein [Propionibacteriaceae bacterium]|nr:pentapeptide repeat-containing protein [Propionibacteriaceae bacterium]